MDYIPKISKADLKDGSYYSGRCRNAELARWDALSEKFYHWRHKFGHRFIEEIRHPEDEKRYDVFVVNEEVAEPTDVNEQIPFPMSRT